MKKSNLIIKAIFIILAVLSFLLLNLPFTIQKSINAVEIKLDDSSYCVERTITVDGKYYVNIFTNNKFIGKISVLEYPKTYENSKLNKLQFYRDMGESDGMLYSLDGGEDYYFGIIHAKIFLHDMVIKVFLQPRGGFYSQNGTCIVANASSYDEALNIYKSYEFN